MQPAAAEQREPRPSWKPALALMAVAFLAYLPFVPHWASYWSVSLATQANGWDARPAFHQPLLWLLLTPFRLLPSAARAPAVLFAHLALAAVVLGLLVRCVQLWPRDRTPDLRQWTPERLGPVTAARLRWLPPLVAALGLALNLPFWIHATSGTGEMITVALVACIFCCLLEFRRDRDVKWLVRLALATGAGLANDWQFTALFPLLLLALGTMIGWGYMLERFATFLVSAAASSSPGMGGTAPRAKLLPQGRTLLRLGLAFSAGLLLLLLVPLLAGWTDDPGLSLVQCLKVPLRWQWQNLHLQWVLLSGDLRGVPLLLTSLVPLLILSVRWQDESVTHHTLSHKLSVQVFGVIHLLIGITCAGVLLDAVYSPANLEGDYPLLPNYFLAALLFGRCLDYFIHRLLGRPNMPGRSPWTPTTRTLHAGLLTLLLGAVVALVIQLAVRNAPVVHLANRRLPEAYERLVLHQLPSGPRILIADDSRLLNLARLRLGGTDTNTLWFDMTRFSQVDYQRRLSRAYPADWQKALDQAPPHDVWTIDQQDRLLLDLARTRPVFQLQPSAFGVFDHFQLEETNLLYRLRPRNLQAPDSLAGRAPAGDQLARAELLRTVIPALTNAVEALKLEAARKNSAGDRLSQLLRIFQLPPPVNGAAIYFSHYYSASFDFHGVALQKAGRWTEAEPAFATALALNPANFVASLNLDYNRRRRNHTDDPNDFLGAPPADFGNFRSLGQAVRNGGPVDVPLHLMILGQDCDQAGLTWQALEQYRRVLELEPANWAAQLWIAGLDLKTSQPDRTLALIQTVRPRLAAIGLLPRFEEDLDQLEIQADLVRKEPAQALAVMDKLIQSGDLNPSLLAALVNNLWQKGFPREVTALLEELTARHPDNSVGFALRAQSRELAGQLAAAVDDFSRVLQLDPANIAVRYRLASDLLALHRPAAARTQLNLLLQQSPATYPAHFALAQVALAETNHALARQELGIFLGSAPTNIPDYAAAQKLLKSLP